MKKLPPPLGSLKTGMQRAGIRVAKGVHTTSDLTRTAASLLRQGMNNAQERYETHEYDSALINGIADTCNRVLNIARAYRLIPTINHKALPSLIPHDAEANSILLRQIINSCDSEAGPNRPLAHQIEDAINLCFEHPSEIPFNKVIEFFQSEALIRPLVQHQGHFQQAAIPSVSNLADGIAETWTKVNRNIADWIHEKQNSLNIKKNPERNKASRPIPEIVIAQLDAQFEHFESEYDPNDSSKSMANFLDQLKKYFRAEDVYVWFDMREDKFVQMLQIKIGSVVTAAYLRRGSQMEPEKFIKSFVSSIITKEPDTIVLNTTQLKNFFSSGLKRLTGKYSLGNLQRLLLKICLEDITTETRLTIKAKTSEKTLEFDSPRELRHALTSEINGHTQIEIGEGKASPFQLPQEINEMYEYCRTAQEGMLNLDRMNHFILQRYQNDNESPDETHTRITRDLETANEAMKELYDRAGIPSLSEIGDHPLVKAANTFDRLLPLAFMQPEDDSELKMQFAAIRKLHLFHAIHRTSNNVGWAYRKHDLSEVRRRFESISGIKIYAYEGITIQYWDSPVGVSLNSENVEAHNPEQQSAGFRLAIIDCSGLLTTDKPMLGNKIIGLCPVSQENGSSDVFSLSDGMSLKPFLSTIFKNFLKNIRGQQQANGTAEDNLRTSLIQLTPDQIKRYLSPAVLWSCLDAEELASLDELIQQYENYTPKEQALYNEAQARILNDKLFPILSRHTRQNQSSSSDFEVDSFRGPTPISSMAGRITSPNSIRDIQYDTTLEIHLYRTLEAYLIAQKSSLSPASHKEYKRRQALEIIAYFFPEEVYPELYETPRTTVTYTYDGLQKTIPAVLQESKSELRLPKSPENTPSASHQPSSQSDSSSHNPEQQ